MTTTRIPTEAKTKVAKFGKLEIIFWVNPDGSFLRFDSVYYPGVWSASQFGDDFYHFITATLIDAEQWPAIIAQADTVEDV